MGFKYIQDNQQQKVGNFSEFVMHKIMDHTIETYYEQPRIVHQYHAYLRRMPEAQPD